MLQKKISCLVIAFREMTFPHLARTKIAGTYTSWLQWISSCLYPILFKFSLTMYMLYYLLLWFFDFLQNKVLRVLFKSTSCTKWQCLSLSGSLCIYMFYFCDFEWLYDNLDHNIRLTMGTIGPITAGFNCKSNYYTMGQR